MRFQVLGPVQATVGEAVVEPTGAKERALLARLVLGVGATVSVADLVDSLWGSEPPRTAAKSLQSHVMRLRNSLEPGRTGFSSVLVTEGRGYRLDVPPDRVDAEQFVRLARAGSAELAARRSAEAASTLRSALRLWRGPAYVGVDAPVVLAAARRLEELRVAALEDRLAAELDLGQAPAVAAELEQLVVEHPYRERSWGLLVLALYRDGRQRDALEAYARCRQVLVGEVGVEPGGELRALHARVLEQDPTLTASRERVVIPPALELADGRLVGRDHELAVLRAFWDDPAAAAPRLLVMRGPHGAGTSRLAAELARHVAWRGSPVTLGRPSADGLAVHDRPAEMPEGDRLSRRVLVLADPDRPVPAGGSVLDLGPLPADAVRALVSGYVGTDRVAEATTYVARESGGWPGAVHAEALGWARREAAEVVEHAAARTGSTTTELRTARHELSDGVLALQDVQAWAAVPTAVSCPWPGLAAYDVADAAMFAGRERLVAEIVARAAGDGVVAVVGGSGSGKSSAVRAGLLPALAAGVLPGSEGWRQLVMRPGPHPMAELARVALSAQDRHADDPGDLGALLERTLRADPQHEKVLLVIDQLEELWTSCADRAERVQFLDTVAELAGTTQVLLVLVLRADFLTELAEHETLAALVGDGAVLVAAPREAEVRRAVALPAQRCGLELETGLLDAVVDDAGREPGVLPLLSTAMVRLWEQRVGRTLTLSAYVGQGGLSGAIARLAEEHYTALAPEERAAARGILLRLAGPGDGDSVVRRRAALTELAALEVPGVADVVEKLAAARLVTLSDGRAEVAHEALFREWPRLRRWLADDTAGRELVRRLAQDAEEWHAAGRDEAVLWRGTRLLAATDALHARGDDATALEREFVALSQAAAEAEQRAVEHRAAVAGRQNTRLRRLLVALALVLVVALLAGGLAWRAQRQADNARASADAKRLAAVAVNQDYLDLALLSAVEAVRAERSPETTGALLTLLSRLPDVLTQVRTPHRFLGAAIMPDRRTVLAWENESSLWALAADSGRTEWIAELDGPVIAAAGSPDGSRLAAAVLLDDVAAAVVVLDRRTGTELGRIVDGTEVPESTGLPAAAVVGLVPQVAWLDDERLAVLGTAGVTVLSGSGLRVVDAVRWRDRPVPFRSVIRAAGPDHVVVTGAVEPGVVVALRTGAVRRIRANGDVLAISPDGAVAAVTSWPDTPHPEQKPALTMVETKTWTAISPRVPLPAFHGAAAFSADGTVLALGVGNALQLRDPRTGALRRELSGHNGVIMGVAFTGDAGDPVWSAARDGAAFQWDPSGRRGVVRAAGAAAAAARQVAESRDGRTGVVLDWHDDKFNEARLVDPATGLSLSPDPLPMPASCACQPFPVAITPDGRTALAGLDELTDPEDWNAPHAGRLVLWDVARRQIRGMLTLPWSPVGIGVAGDGTRAVVNGTGGWAVVDLAEPRVVSRVTDGPPVDLLEVPDTVVVSPDGRRAAVGRAQDVVLVDARTGDELARHRLPDGDGMLTGTWVDRRTLVIGGWGGVLHVLDGQDLTVLAPPRLVAAGWLTDLAVSRTDDFVAAIDTEGKVSLYDTTTWRPLGRAVMQVEDWSALSFSPDGRTLRVWSPESGRVTMTMRSDAWLRQACRVAGRELTQDEWRDVQPGQPWRPTCGPGGQAAVDAVRAAG